MRASVICLIAFALIVAGCTGSAASPTFAAATPAATPFATVSPGSAEPSSAEPSLSPTTAAASSTCPAGQAGFQQPASTLDRSLTLDGTKLTLITAGMGNRSGDYHVDDMVAQWGDLAKLTPTVSASAGGKGTLTGSSGMDLPSGSVSAFPESAFNFATNKFPDFSSVEPTTLNAAAGKLLVPYQAKAGSWVLAFHVTWLTDCLAGDGISFAIVQTK